jgi:pyridoxine kinase
MQILSIQSWVTYGHVGNAAAMFPLQRLGAEVWGVHTVQFSNHTGYGGFTGERFSGAAIEALLEGMARRGALAGCDGLLSGYLGDESIGAAVLKATGVKAHGALYCCDPVIGDNGREYVQPDAAGWIGARLLPRADLLTPNGFELERLTGVAPRTLADALAGVEAVQARMDPNGPAVVLVTSLTLDNTPPDALDVLAADRAGAWLTRLPRLKRGFNGAGDMTASLFLYHYLTTGQAQQAASLALSSVHGVLRRTLESGAAELQIIAAQEEFVRPSTMFAAASCAS